METKRERILKDWLWVSVIPPKDERSGRTRIIMPNKMKRVFDYLYAKEEQPTYEQAGKDLWITPSMVYAQVKNMKNLWMLKTDRRGIITWTLSDFIS